MHIMKSAGRHETAQSRWQGCVVLFIGMMRCLHGAVGHALLPNNGKSPFCVTGAFPESRQQQSHRKAPKPDVQQARAHNKEMVELDQSMSLVATR